MEPARTPVLRASALDELLDNIGPEGVVDLIQTYLDDTPEQLRQLRSAVEAGDAIVVHRTAHSLKSSSAIFGADGMAALCLELEQAAAAGSLDGAASGAGKIAAEFERARLVLEEELDRH